MKQPNIHIAKPCPASWQNMTPNTEGRHCDACNKTVVDFTRMSDEEIKQYFLAQKGERICGHFNSGQVSVPISPWQQRLTQARAAAEGLRFPLAKAAALLVLSGIMMLSGCKNHPQDLNGESLPYDDSSNVQQQCPEDGRLLGDTIYIDSTGK